ncbi:hypothetical protein [Singulisphaera sp. PoT]|uniref:hypothetical protein n=1 Tax=Singulisphaera sp. PoT TaxID=3411797 RepID=UPI003BF61BF0
MARPESIAIKQERHIAETKATLEALRGLPKLLEDIQLQLVAIEERLAKLSASSAPARNRPKDQES